MSSVACVVVAQGCGAEISGAFNAPCAGGGAARQNNTIAGGGRPGSGISGSIGAAPRTGGHGRRQSALRSPSQTTTSTSTKATATRKYKREKQQQQQQQQRTRACLPRTPHAPPHGSAIRCSPASNRSVLRGYMGGVGAGRRTGSERERPGKGVVVVSVVLAHEGFSSPRLGLLQ
jgi:hypothetical protein